MRRLPLSVHLSCLVFLVSSIPVAYGQALSPSPIATSDPQATALVTQALVALGTAAVSDIALTGAVTKSVGPDSETGTFSLKAYGQIASRLDLIMSSGTVSEVRNASVGGPQGIWIGSDGTKHVLAPHNCFNDTAWFFPKLSILNQVSSNPNLVAAYIGREIRVGIPVHHLHFLVRGPSDDSSGIIERLTAEDVYLDASSLVPVAFTFNSHPDSDALTNIPVEVDFFDYRPVNGVGVPFRIQKFFNGSLVLDLTIQNATVNSGLTSSDFSVQ